MKLWIALLSTLLICSTIEAQWSGKSTFDKKIWDSFKNSTLNVVLDGNNEEFDKDFKSLIENEWKFNKFQFIDADEFESMKVSDQNFFLIVVDYEYKKTNSGITTAKFDLNYLMILQGRKSGDIEWMPRLADIQMSSPSSMFSNQLPLFIRNIQSFCVNVSNGTFRSAGDYKKTLKTDKEKIQSQTLYIQNEYFNNKVASADDLKKEYPGPVEGADEGKIKDLTNGKNIGSIFVVVESGGKAWAYVYDIQTGDILYYGYNLVSKQYPVGVIAWHYKKWS